jgi:hypothetical protein
MPARSHVVPIHIGTPEHILSIGPLSLTAKQFLLLLLGSALSYRLWQGLAGVASGPGQILCFCVALLPALGALACAFVQVAGRSLDQWGLVLLRFCLSPRVLLWRSLRHFPDQLYPRLVEEAEDEERLPIRCWTIAP